jgi:GntR family transcriptional regulator
LIFSKFFLDLTDFINDISVNWFILVLKKTGQKRGEMNDNDFGDLFAPVHWFRIGRGPRYQQLHRYLAEQIQQGHLSADRQLPPERDLAARAQVSRVTIRQAISQLVLDGLLEQRRGSGTYVLRQAARHEHSLSSLISFSESMKQRGSTSDSKVLSAGLFSPTPEEVVSLGLVSGVRISRIERLRIADGVPMALEVSSLPENILHQPEVVSTSLYSVLRDLGRAPTRAIQRVSAVNLSAKEAQLLNMTPNSAALKIVRTGYLESGRPIEFTRGLYRSETYDFVTELRLKE